MAIKGDTGIRNYLNNPLITDTSKHDDPQNFQQLITKDSDLSKYNILNFEAFNLEGDVQNIINRYITYLSQFTVKLIFDPYTSAHFSERPMQLAKYLYGDTSMFWIIYNFNPIQHSSEMSRDFLLTNGLLVLSAKGVDKLKEILKLKERLETQQSGSMYQPT